MEINASTLSAQAMSTNKAYTNGEILSRSMAKSDSYNASQPAEQKQVPEVGTKSVQGMIDIYA